MSWGTLDSLAELTTPQLLIAAANITIPLPASKGLAFPFPLT
jgi:hypothetical protein